jgi:hypothetical protein
MPLSQIYTTFPSTVGEYPSLVKDPSPSVFARRLAKVYDGRCDGAGLCLALSSNPDVYERGAD